MAALSIKYHQNPSQCQSMNASGVVNLFSSTQHTPVAPAMCVPPKQKTDSEKSPICLSTHDIHKRIILKNYNNYGYW